MNDHRIVFQNPLNPPLAKPDAAPADGTPKANEQPPADYFAAVRDTVGDPK
ncbi:MAG: hypothetical protein GX862_07325 [Leucobacter sp.]|jgi:hypothetical protein|nr:hypothetical protein [Leucobacter sp.]